MTHRTRLSLTAVVLASALHASSAQAAIEAWTVGAPDGGVIHAAALAGSQAYAGYAAFDNFAGIPDNGGGMFRSADGGSTWERVETLGYREVRDVAIDPAPGAPVYAATGSGMFRSVDGGTNWADITPFGGIAFDVVAVDEGAPGTAYVVGESPHGVWRTTNAGVGTWQALPDGLGGPALRGIIVNPQTHDAWAWRGNTVYWLIADTTTWLSASAGLASGTVRGIAVDPSGSGRLILASSVGAYWLPGNGAASWQAINGGLGSNSDLTAITADAGGTVYARELSGGVWKLAPGATTWQAAASGLPASLVSGLAGDSVIPGRALAVSEAGGQSPLWRTLDAGGSWSRASSGIAAVAVEAIAIDPRKPGTVVAATAHDAVLRSSDGGTTWAPGATGLPSGRVYSVAADGGREGTFYAGTFAAGVFRSRDGGATWSATAAGPSTVGELATDPARPGLVYAGRGQTAEIWRSPDEGLSWVPLPLAGMPSAIVSDLEADPQSPGAVYAITRAGVFRLAEGAGAWTTVTPFAGVVARDIALSPRQSSTWLAATNGGVLRSSDAGLTWVFASNGIFEIDVRAVAFDPQLDDVAYAASAGGVYRTGDGGGSWTLLTGGLKVAPTHQLVFDADGRTLYAGTRARGVFARTRAVAPATSANPATTPTPLAASAQSKPRAVSKPLLKGIARVGKRLRANVKLVAFPQAKLTWRWERCTARGKRCKAIKGATKSSYLIKRADRGRRLRAAGTATNPVGKLVVRTKLTPVVQ